MNNKHIQYRQYVCVCVCVCPVAVLGMGEPDSAENVKAVRNCASAQLRGNIAPHQWRFWAWANRAAAQGSISFP